MVETGRVVTGVRLLVRRNVVHQELQNDVLVDDGHVIVGELAVVSPRLATIWWMTMLLSLLGPPCRTLKPCRLDHWSELE